MHSIAVQRAGRVDKQVWRTIEQADSSTSAQRGTIRTLRFSMKPCRYPRRSKEEVVNWLEERQCSQPIRVSASQYFFSSASFKAKGAVRSYARLIPVSSSTIKPVLPIPVMKPTLGERCDLKLPPVLRRCERPLKAIVTTIKCDLELGMKLIMR